MYFPLLLLVPVLDSSTFLQRFGNDPLKLAVRTTKLIGCPFFNGIHCFGIYAQNETFS